MVEYWKSKFTLKYLGLNQKPKQNNCFYGTFSKHINQKELLFSTTSEGQVGRHCGQVDYVDHMTFLSEGRWEGHSEGPGASNSVPKPGDETHYLYYDPPGQNQYDKPSLI